MVNEINNDYFVMITVDASRRRLAIELRLTQYTNAI